MGEVLGGRCSGGRVQVPGGRVAGLPGSNGTAFVTNGGLQAAGFKLQAGWTVVDERAPIRLVEKEAARCTLRGGQISQPR